MISKELLVELCLKDNDIIQQIKIQSVLNEVVKRDPILLQLISKPTEEMIKSSLKNNPFALFQL